MNLERCPSGDELVRFVDRDLTPEQLERVALHVARCAECGAARDRLQQLVADLKVPVPGAALALDAHVAAVMSRLDTPVLDARRPRARIWVAGVLLAAAAVVLLLQWREARGRARVERGHAELAQVAVQLYAEERAAQPLVAGAAVSAHAQLQARVRNGSRRAAHVLVFAFDADQTRRWIAPHLPPEAAEKAGDGAGGPAALVRALVPSRSESPGMLDQLAPKLRRLATPAPRVPPGGALRALGDPVELAGLRCGPLRVLFLVSAKALHVAEIELASADAPSAAVLQRRLPDAVVRELPLALVP